jgi:hypothetical protein
MSDLDPENSNVVELSKGYIDMEGAAHRLVKVRAPKVADELHAEAEANKRWNEPGDMGFAAFLIKACIVQWEGLADVQFQHITELPRPDFSKLHNRIQALENEQVAQGNAPDENEPN